MTEAGGEGIKPRIPKFKMEGTYDPPSPDLLNGSRVSKQTPDKPHRPVPPASSDALVAAVGKIFQAVTAQISYHEREAQKLRESLKPFAGLSRPNVAPDGNVSADGLRALLDLADKLTPTGDTQT